MMGCEVETKNSSGKMNLTLWLRAPPEQKLGTPSHAPGEAIFCIRQGSENWACRAWEPHLCLPIALATGSWCPSPWAVIADYTRQSKEAEDRRRSFEYSVIVDVHGMPQNPRVVKSMDPGLDQSALNCQSANIASRQRRNARSRNDHGRSKLSSKLACCPAPRPAPGRSQAGAACSRLQVFRAGCSRYKPVDQYRARVAVATMIDGSAVAFRLFAAINSTDQVADHTRLSLH